MGRKRGFADVVASVKPLTKSVRLCLDGTLVAEIERLNALYVTALVADENTNEPDTAPRLREQLEQLQAQAADAEVEFVFRAIGRLPWRNLIAQHPPKKEDRERGADFDPAKLPVAAMAASCVEPDGADVEGFEALADTLSDGQWNRLWATCHAANTTDGDVPNLVAAFAPARPTEQN